MPEMTEEEYAQWCDEKELNEDLEREESDDPENAEDEPGICLTCNGSGEGAYEGTTCRACKGKGER